MAYWPEGYAIRSGWRNPFVFILTRFCPEVRKSTLFILPREGGDPFASAEFSSVCSLIAVVRVSEFFFLHLFDNDLPHMSIFMLINTLQTLEITSSFTITENSFLRTFAPLTTKINLFIYVY